MELVVRKRSSNQWSCKGPEAAIDRVALGRCLRHQFMGNEHGVVIPGLRPSAASRTGNSVPPHSGHV